MRAIWGAGTTKGNWKLSYRLRVFMIGIMVITVATVIYHMTTGTGRRPLHQERLTQTSGGARCSRSQTSNCLMVETTEGKILGTAIKVNQSGTTFHTTAFLGIPFASNAGGERRFRKPSPPTLWKGVFNGTFPRPPCRQPDQYLPKNYTVSARNTTEDCLHLNVWVPTKCVTPRNNYAVVFWVYGGSFRYGGNSYDVYDGRFLSAFGDVIVVAPNYRLGAFGFLNVGTDDAPGNMAIHDVLFALKWVKNNIACFGGNPDSVLLSGQSAGAIMMSLLLMSPQLPRFDIVRAHLMSGSAFTPLSSNSGNYAKAKAEKFSKMAHCQDDSKSDVMECLRKINSSDVVLLGSRDDLYFAPSYGDDVIPQAPNLLMRAATFQPRIKEMLLTNTYSEGDALFETFVKNVSDGKESITEKALKEAFPDLLRGMPLGILNPSLLASFGYNVNSGNQWMADIIGDVYIRCATKKFAKDAADRGAVVYYQEYVPKPSYSVFSGDFATHSEDTPVMFGFAFLYPWLASDIERNTSLRMMQTISTFAKDG